MSARRSRRIRLHERHRHWELQLLSDYEDEDEFTRGLENLRDGLVNTVSAIFTASGLQLEALARARTRPKPDAWSLFGARERFLTPRYHQLAFGMPVEVSKVSAGGDVCSQPAMKLKGLTCTSADSSLVFVFLPMASFFMAPQIVDNVTDLTSRIFVPSSAEVEAALCHETPTESTTRVRGLIRGSPERERAREERRIYRKNLIRGSPEERAWEEGRNYERGQIRGSPEEERAKAERRNYERGLIRGSPEEERAKEERRIYERGLIRGSPEEERAREERRIYERDLTRGSPEEERAREERRIYERGLIRGSPEEERAREERRIYERGLIRGSPEEERAREERRIYERGLIRGSPEEERAREERRIYERGLIRGSPEEERAREERRIYERGLIRGSPEEERAREEGTIYGRGLIRGSPEEERAREEGTIYGRGLIRGSPEEERAREEGTIYGRGLIRGSPEEERAREEGTIYGRGLIRGSPEEERAREEGTIYGRGPIRGSPEEERAREEGTIYGRGLIRGSPEEERAREEGTLYGRGLIRGSPEEERAREEGTIYGRGLIRGSPEEERAREEGTLYGRGLIRGSPEEERAREEGTIYGSGLIGRSPEEERAWEEGRLYERDMHRGSPEEERAREERMIYGREQSIQYENEQMENRRSEIVQVEQRQAQVEQQLQVEKKKIEEEQIVVQEEKKQLDTRKELIDTKEEVLVQKEKELEEQQTSLEEKSYQLDEKKESLDTKEEVLVQKEQELEEQQTSLEEKSCQLDDRKESLDTKEEVLVQKEQELEEQQTSLEEKSCQLDDRKESLDTKEEVLVQKEQELEEQQKSLEEKSCQLDERKESLDTKEEVLVQKEQELEEQQKSLEEKSCQLDARNEELQAEAQKQAEEQERLDNREEELNSKDQDLKFKEEILQQETEAVKERELRAEEKERELEKTDQRLQEEEERLRGVEETLAETQAQLAAENQRLSELQTFLEGVEETLKEREAKAEEFDSELKEKAAGLAQKEEELAAIEQYQKEMDEKLKAMFVAAEVREAILNGRQQLIEEAELKHQAWEIKAKEEEERLKGRERQIEENEETHREWEIKSREEKQMIEERQKALEELEDMLKEWERRSQEEEEKLKEEEAKIREAEEELRDREQKVADEEVKQKDRRRILEEEEERQKKVIQKLEEEEEKQREVEQKLEVEEKKIAQRERHIKKEHRKMSEEAETSRQTQKRKAKEGAETSQGTGAANSRSPLRLRSTSPSSAEPRPMSSILVEDDVLMVSSFKDRQSKSTILETYDIKYVRESIREDSQLSVYTHGYIDSSKGVRVSRASESYVLSADELGRESVRSRSRSPNSQRTASSSMSESSKQSIETQPVDFSASPGKAPENDTEEDSGTIQGNPIRSVSFCEGPTEVRTIPVDSYEHVNDSSDRSHSKSPPPMLDRRMCSSPIITLSQESRKPSPALWTDTSLLGASTWNITETGVDKPLTHGPVANHHSFLSAPTQLKTVLGSDQVDAAKSTEEATPGDEESHDTTNTCSPKLPLETSPVISLKLRVLETVEEYGEDQETEGDSSSQIPAETMAPEKTEEITSSASHTADIVGMTAAPQKATRTTYNDGYSLDKVDFVFSSDDSDESGPTVSIDCISPKLAEMFSPVFIKAGEPQAMQVATGDLDVASTKLPQLSEKVSTACTVSGTRIENVQKLGEESDVGSDGQLTPPTLDEWSADESAVNDTDRAQDVLRENLPSVKDESPCLPSSVKLLSSPQKLFSVGEQKREHTTRGLSEKQASPSSPRIIPKSSPKQFIFSPPISSISPPRPVGQSSPLRETTPEAAFKSPQWSPSSSPKQSTPKAALKSPKQSPGVALSSPQESPSSSPKRSTPEAALNSAQQSPSSSPKRSTLEVVLKSQHESPSTSPKRSTPEVAFTFQKESSSISPKRSTPEVALKFQQDSPSISPKRSTPEVALKFQQDSPSISPKRSTPEVALKSAQQSPKRSTPEVALKFQQDSPSISPKRSTPEVALKFQQDSPSISPKRSTPEVALKSAQQSPRRSTPEVALKPPEQSSSSSPKRSTLEAVLNYPQQSPLLSSERSTPEAALKSPQQSPPSSPKRSTPEVALVSSKRSPSSSPKWSTPEVALESPKRSHSVSFKQSTLQVALKSPQRSPLLPPKQSTRIAVNESPKRSPSSSPKRSLSSRDSIPSSPPLLKTSPMQLNRGTPSPLSTQRSGSRRSSPKAMLSNLVLSKGSSSSSTTASSIVFGGSRSPSPAKSSPARSPVLKNLLERESVFQSRSPTQGNSPAHKPESPLLSPRRSPPRPLSKSSRRRTASSSSKSSSLRSTSRTGTMSPSVSIKGGNLKFSAEPSPTASPSPGRALSPFLATVAEILAKAQPSGLGTLESISPQTSPLKQSSFGRGSSPHVNYGLSLPSPKPWSQSQRQTRTESPSPVRAQIEAAVPRVPSESPTQQPKQKSLPARRRSSSATLSFKTRLCQKRMSLSASPSARYSPAVVAKTQESSIPYSRHSGTHVSAHSLSPIRKTSTSSQSTLSISPTGRLSASSVKVRHTSPPSALRSPERRRHLSTPSSESRHDPSAKSTSLTKCASQSPKILSSLQPSPKITTSMSPSPVVTKSPYPSPIITKSPYPSPVAFDSPSPSIKALRHSNLQTLVVNQEMSLSSSATSDERITLSTVSTALLSKTEPRPESNCSPPSGSKRSPPQLVEPGDQSPEPSKRLKLSSRTVSFPMVGSKLPPQDSDHSNDIPSLTSTPPLSTPQLPPSNSGSSVSMISQSSAARTSRKSPVPGRRSATSVRLSPVQDRSMSDMLEAQRRRAASPRPSDLVTLSRRTPQQTLTGERTLSDVLASLPAASSPPVPVSPLPSPVLRRKADSATVSAAAGNRPSSSSELRGRESRAASVSPKPTQVGAALQAKGTVGLKNMLARQRKASQNRKTKPAPTKVTPPIIRKGQIAVSSEVSSSTCESTTSSYMSTSLYRKRVDKDFGPPSSIVTITQKNVRYTREPVNKDTQHSGSKHPSPPMISSSVPLPIADTVHQPTPIVPGKREEATYRQHRMKSAPVPMPTSSEKSDDNAYSSGSRRQTTSYSAMGRSRENDQHKTNVHTNTKPRPDAMPPSPMPRLSLLQIIDAEQQREEHDGESVPGRRHASAHSPRTAGGSESSTIKVISPRSTSHSPSGYKSEKRLSVIDPYQTYPPTRLLKHDSTREKRFLASEASNYGTEQMKERERIIRSRLRAKKQIKDIDTNRVEARSGDSDYSSDFSDFFKEYQTECKIKGILPTEKRESPPVLPQRRAHNFKAKTSSPKSKDKPSLPKKREDLTFTSPPFKRRALSGYEESKARQSMMIQTWSSETNSAGENTCNSSPTKRMRSLELSRFKAYPRRSPRSSPGSSMVIRDSNELPMALSQQLHTHRHQQGIVGDSVEMMQIGRPSRMSPFQSPPTLQLAREDHPANRSPRKHGRRVSWNDNHTRGAEAMVTDDSCNQNAAPWTEEDLSGDSLATRGSFPIVHDKLYGWKRNAEYDSQQSQGLSSSDDTISNLEDRCKHSQGDGFQTCAENKMSPHHSMTTEVTPHPQPRIPPHGTMHSTTVNCSRMVSDIGSTGKKINSCDDGEKEKSSNIQFCREQRQTTEYRSNETPAFAREELVERKEFTAKSDSTITTVGQKHSLRKRYTMQNQHRRASVTEERQHTREYIFKKNAQTARFPESETGQRVQATPPALGGDSKRSPTYQRTQQQQKRDSSEIPSAVSKTQTPTKPTDVTVDSELSQNVQTHSVRTSSVSRESVNNLSLCDELRNAGFFPPQQRSNAVDGSPHDNQTVVGDDSENVMDYSAVDQWLEESVDPYYHHSRSHIYDLNESANSSVLADSEGETLSPCNDNLCDGWDCTFFTPKGDQDNIVGAVGGDTGISAQHHTVVEYDNLGFHSPRRSDSSDLDDHEEWLAAAGTGWNHTSDTYEETCKGGSRINLDETDNALYFSVPSNTFTENRIAPSTSTLPTTHAPISRRRRYSLRSVNKNNSGDDYLKLSPQLNPRYRGPGQEQAQRGGISKTIACAGEAIRKTKAVDVEKANPVRNGRLKKHSPEASTKVSARRRRRSFGKSYMSRMLARREQSQSQDSSDNCAYRHSCRVVEGGGCTHCSPEDDAARGYSQSESDMCRAQNCTCNRGEQERFDPNYDHYQQRTPTADDHEDDEADGCQTVEECECAANLAAALNIQDNSVIPRAVNHHLRKKSEYTGECHDADCEGLGPEHKRLDDEAEDSNSFEEAVEEEPSSQGSIPSAYSDECQCGGQGYRSPEQGGDGDYNLSKCQHYSQHRIDGNRRKPQFEARQDKGESLGDDDKGKEEDGEENAHIFDRRDHYHRHHRDHQQQHLHHHNYQRYQRLTPPPPPLPKPDHHHKQQQTSDTICPVTTNKVPPPRAPSPRDTTNNFTVTESMILAYGYNPLKESPFTARGYPPLQMDTSSLDHISVPFVKRKALVFLRTDKEEFVEVGRGTYGCVYLAQATTRRGTARVVVKDFFADSTSWDLIVHEARMLCYLQNTGVIPHFYGLLKRRSLGDDFSLIQQYFAQGKTLHTALVDKEQLAPNVWLDIAWQLAFGLLLIHERHVLLNDLKGDNVLIDLRRERKVIKYIDLGMATFRKGLNFHLPEDQMSKFNFLSPEVRAGAYTSPMSDVYSLGYLLDQINRLAQMPVLKDISARCMDELPMDRPSLPDVVDILLPDSDQLPSGCSD